jgi:hypothetical protein
MRRSKTNSGSPGLLPIIAGSQGSVDTKNCY